MWALLQPRGYLGGFVLYLALAVGVVGIFFGGFTIRQPAVTDRPLVGLDGLALPLPLRDDRVRRVLGFHGLVCSGTTSKQIARESHCRPIGYGAMLLEAFVALIALATVMILTPARGEGHSSPACSTATGSARFLALIFGEGHTRSLRTFGAMAFSTFVFDTLDVATRLGRYILQELFGEARPRLARSPRRRRRRASRSLILLAAGKASYQIFWTLFGTSNQLLAALTLLGVTVWLKQTGTSVLVHRRSRCSS